MPPTRRAVKGSRLTAAEYDANLDSIDLLNPRVLTISSGSIAITGPGVWHIQTEGAAATDDLTAITGGLGHFWEIILMLATTGQTITVVNTPPNFLVGPPGSFILNSQNDTIRFMDRTTSIWRETGRFTV
jgi:hypothetical protein